MVPDQGLSEIDSARTVSESVAAFAPTTLTRSNALLQPIV